MEEKEQVTPKVCILCAGIGSRLGKRTDFTNKALLKVGNKAVISHTIDAFPNNTEFVICLGYKGDIVKQYLTLFHPEKQFEFVEVDKYEGEGTGPGYSLLQCYDKLQCPFYFVSCDSIIDWKERNILSNKLSWAGYATVPESSKDAYCTIYSPCGCCVVDFFDKSKEGTTEAFIGVSLIVEYQEFWKLLKEQKTTTNNEIQVAPAILSLKHITPIEVEWFDTGNEEGLQKARAHFKGLQNLDKLEEEIYFNDNSVIKYFHNEKNIEGRINRANFLKGLIPDITEHTKNFYKYNFVKGKDLFDVDDFNEVLPSLLNYAKNNLWKNYKLSKQERKNFKSLCKKFYYDKTISRLEKLYKEKFCDTNKTINGIAIPSMDNLLKSIDWDWISDGLPSNFHGDFYLANVLMDENKNFKIIDYRQDFCGNIEYGDRYYDLAKIDCSLTIPYSSIKKNKFKIIEDERNVQISIDKPLFYQKSFTIFYQFLVDEGYDWKKVNVLKSIAILNMSPLHEPPLDKWLFYVGKYCLFQNL